MCRFGWFIGVSTALQTDTDEGPEAEVEVKVEKVEGNGDARGF